MVAERGDDIDRIMGLCDVVRNVGFDIHRYLGPGHLEKVYENALAHRLTKMGIEVRQQHPLEVFDEDGTVLGQYFADLFVARSFLVELKATRTVADEHTAQLLGYLRAARIEHGLLINFGGSRYWIRKFIMSRELSATGAYGPRRSAD